jgi:hypothetical protein
MKARFRELNANPKYVILCATIDEVVVGSIMGIVCDELYGGGTWLRKPHLVRLAPEGWRQDHAAQGALRIGYVDEEFAESSATLRQSRAALRAAGEDRRGSESGLNFAHASPLALYLLC